jgi:hypothetical protein
MNIFVILWGWKALCLICSDSIAVLKEYNLLVITIRSRKKNKKLCWCCKKGKHDCFKNGD